MELVESSLFVPLLILAVTQIIKAEVPAIAGRLTITLAIGVGAVVALIDTHIGLTDISVALGIVYALGAVGIATAASKAGGGARGDVPAA